MTCANSKAAIIGAGVIGAGWAARFLLNGWDVVIFDPNPDVKRSVQDVLTNAERSLPTLYDRRLPARGALTFARSLSEAVADADWIQESVAERLDLKQQVLGEILAHAKDSAVVASSTSGFKPSELNAELGDAHPGDTQPPVTAAETRPNAGQTGTAKRSDRVIVAHPFNPVYLLPAVELVGAQLPCDRASEQLTEIGMHPLTVRKEIDAHVADRLLEAVWREALWLVKDGIATTGEIDDVIRYGFGLRWAQMGLFETYRIAGGEAGMQHFLAQFGPALKWPWTRLTDVPELTDDLIATIASQSDAQSGHLSIRELERLRDDNLVVMLRALKARSSAAGKIILRHERSLAPPQHMQLGRDVQADTSSPFRTVDRVVPIDWTDYNGHMNESRYGQAFSDAADGILERIGAGSDYVATGLSYFTVDQRVRFLAETHAGDRITVESLILHAEGKKLRLFHRMKNQAGDNIATGEQLLIHVDLTTRRAAPPTPEVARTAETLAARHAKIKQPDPGELLPSAETMQA